MPPAPAGLRVGLFGGSFDPPHEGHLLVAETALRRLRLDRLWWIVSPGNPLKAGRPPAPLADRLALCRRLAEDRRIVVTAFEASHDVRYTADMVDLVLTHRPAARFVWVMGADNLATFHRWQSWRAIAARLPIAVVDRPGATLAPLSSPAARTLAAARLPEADARLLPALAPPAWTFLHGRRSALSSTRLREAAPRSS
ncbi:nicotinate-nucleotide adenylyltransferase [Aureimonas flava]|uniref:Probable nicotinate-nucleotide adenylyltransferase n=1 Tax=Aureimonas flava TaxID=2320271 RepID=A0A3A1WKA6_9HYPH|nr:nicotinate-nucleotide adenylyltransferase [Aureimonas flava]RIY01046.1 nicotinate-nucleotide adenylyltransferase [Aureimonas flava]